MKNETLDKYFGGLKNTLNERKINSLDVKLIKDLFDYDIERLKSYIDLKDVGKISFSRNYIFACTKTTFFERTRYENDRHSTKESFEADFRKEFSDKFPNIEATFSTRIWEYNQFSSVSPNTKYIMSFDTWRNELDEYYIIKMYIDLIVDKTPLKAEDGSRERKLIEVFLRGEIPLDEFEQYIASVQSANVFLKYT